MSSSDIFDVLNIKPKSQSPQNNDTNATRKSKFSGSSEISSSNLSPSVGGVSVPLIKYTTSKHQVTGMQRE